MGRRPEFLAPCRTVEKKEIHGTRVAKSIQRLDGLEPDARRVVLEGLDKRLNYFDVAGGAQSPGRYGADTLICAVKFCEQCLVRRFVLGDRLISGSWAGELVDS